MSKFKIGDKVRVKYIPNVEDSHFLDEIRGVQEVGSVLDDGYYAKEDGPYKLVGTSWNFSDDSLELLEASSEAVSTTQRTLLGLEIEYKVLHDRAVETLHQMNLVQLEIQKLREMDE